MTSKNSSKINIAIMLAAMLVLFVGACKNNEENPLTYNNMALLE